MADFELKLNEADVLSAARAAFKEANERFAVESTEEITANKWDWPTGKSPRDIVDTGQLRGSYQADAQPDQYQNSWDVEYAAAVHNGAVFKNGHSMPARPWTKQPLDNFEGNFKTLLGKKL